MGAFEYQALDQDGRTRRGIAEGETPRQIRDQLRGQGLTPLEVLPVTEPGGRGVGGMAIAGSERAVVLRQMATLVSAGLPLEEVLGTVAEQSLGRAAQAIFTTLRARVREGHDLAEGLRLFPRAFPPEVVAAVAAGERSGALDRVLERLAAFAESRQGLGRELALALLYPLIVVAVAIVVIMALMITVVPRVVRVFEHADRELPWLTRVLIDASDFFGAHGIWFGLLLAAVVIAVPVALRRQRPRAALQGALLRIPVLGRALRASATARFCRSLSLQLSSDVPLVEALQVSADSAGVLAIRNAIRAASRRVREGVGLASAIGADPVLPPLVMRLLASGEQTGRLPEMLDRAAEAQEREASALARTVSAVLQPAMILLVGMFVLLVVLAVMLPILDLNRLLA